jgi:hypothetical protein
MRKSYKILITKPEANCSLGRRWEDNVIIGFEVFTAVVM